MVFGLFASMIAMWFSRYREFRADAGGARLAGRDKMIAALQRLSQTYGEATLPKTIAAFGISGGVGEWPQAPADEPSAAGRAHRRPAVGGLTFLFLSILFTRPSP